MADFVVPRHSAVMERLRRRIELCRRHHGNCESHYDAVAGERLEIERQHTFQLHQRCLQAKAKRAGKHRQQPPANTDAARSNQASSGTMEPGDGGSNGEQCRNSTLIALHETVKRKLDSAASPQNGDQQNGFGDIFSVSKKLRHDDGLTSVIGSSNGMPPVSPLHQLDSKPPNGDSLQLNGSHSIGLDGVSKKCLPDAGLQLNGNGDADDFTLCLGKEMKQEPVDDLPCMLSGVGGSMSQNNLMPDLNLNEQEWKELIEELNKSVPDEDMKDIFNDDFEDKKDNDASNSATQTPSTQDIHIKTEFSPAAFEQDSLGSPQVRSPQVRSPQVRSSPFGGANSVPTSSSSPVVGGSQTVFQQSSGTESSNQTAMQPPNQSQNVQRPLPNVLMSGQGAGTTKEMSSTHQLQQIAAKQKRDQLLQNQQQAQQVHQSNQMTNWQQSRSSQSPLGVPYSMDKPTSPSVYQQDFNNQKLMMPKMNKNSPRGGGSYMQPNHVNMIGHKPSSSLNPNHSVGPNAMLDYGNTIPLSHYEADCGPGVVTQNQNKNVMISYLQQRQQQSSQQQLPPMTEEQSRMFMMKQKAGIPYRPLVSHGQDQNPQPNVARVPVSVGGPGVVAQPPTVSMAGNHGNAPYLNSQQQALMKQQQQQQLLLEQQKQREQKQQLLLEQQKQQYLLGQRQQQQQQLLAEQEKQRHQQEQLQRHLTRPPPQYQDQQQNSYPQQTVGPFPGSTSVMPGVNNMAHQTSGSPRMFTQSQPMLQMGGGHAAVPPLSSVANSQERAVSQYPNMQNVQRSGMYNMGSGLPQMVQNHAAQGNMSNGQPQIQRQPNMGQGNTLPTGYGPNTMANSALAAQHNKAGMNPAISKSQMPRMPAMASQNPGWQHQQIQNINNQAQGNTGLSAFNAANPGFHLQQNHHKIPNQPFVQGLPQVGLGAGRPMNSLNGSVPGQMMQNMASQQRTNPATQQPTPNQQVLPVMNQAVPDLTAFSQNPGQQMANRVGLHCNQNYQVRATGQDMQFGFGGQSGNAGLQNLSGDADLLDCLLKDRTSAEEWMNDLDEFLGNH
ncbi:mastermind-like protein 1 isoform X2 [Bufo bufo]|uniref:mastermind-like protein 1 isoform X2 n=1 Tax=Bufo bufo TaxID=8384 RepID=UPI001ABEDFAB|nr:mastermind-like protein 1 isoform X2 [Bufo bufo]